MKAILREYGLIAILIIVSVSGYLAFTEHKEELIAFSLDTVGSHLSEMVDDPVARDRLAVAFSTFRERVGNQEVPPEEVEFVTASLLNLTTSGERLGADDVDMVMHLWEPPAVELPKPDAPSPVDWNLAAARVNEAVSIANKAISSIPADSLRQRAILFSTNESGAIRISVDSDATVFLTDTHDAELPTLVRIDSTLKERHVRLSNWILKRKAVNERALAVDSLARVIELGIFADIDTMSLRLETKNLLPRTLVTPKTSAVDNQ